LLCVSVVIALFALISICTGSVFFMLAFVRALLREARRPRARLAARHDSREGRAAWRAGRRETAP